MLLKVPFFRDLHKRTRRALGDILQIEYLKGDGTVIFNEGDAADKLYIIVEGKVSIYRSNTEGIEDIVCTYSTHAERPTFGELALWSSKPRAGTARCIEPSNLLVVRSSDFSTFLELVPEFQDMFSTYASSFDSLNRLKADHENHGRTFKIPSKKALKALKRMLGSMLKNDDEEEEADGGGGGSGQRKGGGGSFLGMLGLTRHKDSTYETRMRHMKHERDDDDDEKRPLTRSDLAWKRLAEYMLSIVDGLEELGMDEGLGEGEGKQERGQAAYVAILK